MNFACMAGVAPGPTLTDQCAAIAAAGCAGVESIVFPHTPLEAWVGEMRRAAGMFDLAPVAVVLGGLALYEPGRAGWVGEALAAVGEVGAAALLTPEYRAQDPLPLFPPFPQPLAAEQAQVDDALHALAEQAVVRGVPLLLEPITQFEGRFWRTVATVRSVCTRLTADISGLECGVAVDFHNMNVTEDDPVAAIEHAGAWVRHVHLSDNNRRLPGKGHIDFAPGLRTLQGMGYTGWYSFECAVDDEFVPEVRAAIGRLNVLALPA
jgi:sugar phosphate isomerase/epimerase